MSLPFPEPTGPPVSRAEIFLGYLNYFRSVVVTKVERLQDDQLRTSLLPSGWTPIELVQHPTHVERRWLVWRFEGQPLAQPWGDAQDGRWSVSAEEDAYGLARMHRSGRGVTACSKDQVASELGECGC